MCLSNLSLRWTRSPILRLMTHLFVLLAGGSFGSFDLAAAFLAFLNL